MRQLHIFSLLTLLVLAPSLASAQNFGLLEKYLKSTYYELEFDDNGNEVVRTKCNEPTSFLKFICPKGDKDCHFTYDVSIYHISSVTKGGNEEEYLLKYRNDFGEEETAIFYYDRIVHQLLLTFDGMNLAFVAKEDLDKFTVKDECH